MEKIKILKNGKVRPWGSLTQTGDQRVIDTCIIMGLVHQFTIAETIYLIAKAAGVHLRSEYIEQQYKHLYETYKLKKTKKSIVTLCNRLMRKYAIKTNRSLEQVQRFSENLNIGAITLTNALDRPIVMGKAKYIEDMVKSIRHNKQKKPIILDYYQAINIFPGIFLEGTKLGLTGTEIKAQLLYATESSSHRLKLDKKVLIMTRKYAVKMWEKAGYSINTNPSKLMIKKLCLHNNQYLNELDREKITLYSSNNPITHPKKEIIKSEKKEKPNNYLIAFKYRKQIKEIVEFLEAGHNKNFQKLPMALQENAYNIFYEMNKIKINKKIVKFVINAEKNAKDTRSYF